MFDSDTVFNYIGYAAGLATIIAFAIQTGASCEPNNQRLVQLYVYNVQPELNLLVCLWYLY